MDTIKIITEEKVFNVSRFTTVEDFLRSYCNESVIGLMVDGKAVHTDYEFAEDSKVNYLTLNDRTGIKIYIKGLEFLFLLAVHEVFGDSSKAAIKYSIDKSLYCEINIGRDLNEKDINKLRESMNGLAKEDIPFKKVSSSRSDAIKYFNKRGETEKSLNYKYMYADSVTLYKAKGLYNYFYYVMPLSTASVSKFELTLVGDNGVVLSYPIGDSIPKYNDSPLVLSSFKTSEQKLQKMDILYASDINKKVVDGSIRDYIQMIEKLYADDLDKIANKIANNRKIKAIFIAGPSSSGKTTSSKRLALSLKSNGIDSFLISTDDYFLNREESPKDKDGNYDFETIEAIDVKLFSDHLRKLLNGEEVVMPTFNFITGEKEFKSKPTMLKPNQILIVEGLHAINEKINGKIPHDNKIKIYLSPFTPVGLDRHNHISTTDLRFVRRLVRDYNTRGYSAFDTLKKWKEMRPSEEKNVYPYQRSADYILNTSLAYEIGVLKTYAVPLLYSVESDSEYYEEAKRILIFLQGFINVTSKYVPNTSILREFIGDSFFE